VPLRHWLIGHHVETAYQGGWSKLTNGNSSECLRRPISTYMLTTGQGIRFRQNLAGRRLALVAINTNDWTRIRKSKSIVVDAISETGGISPGNRDTISRNLGH
jgi:hypothetical protein